MHAPTLAVGRPGSVTESRLAQIINFATITPLPMGMAPDLLKAKKGELDQSVRVDLRMKLGWFFGRDAEDVADETKKAPPEESQTESGDG